MPRTVALTTMLGGFDTEEMMGKVIQLPKRNVQHASTEQLKHEWDLWAETDQEELAGVEFHYEQIHAELNRRGEGRHCAV